MPNWVEGTFRIKGPKENVLKFAAEGLSAVARNGPITVKRYDEGDGVIHFDFMDAKLDKPPCMLYIEGTKRHFLDDISYGIDVYENDEGEYQLVAPFQAAWLIHLDDLKAIADKYGVDVKANGYELGFQFEQIIEINRSGEVLTAKKIKYDTTAGNVLCRC